MAPPTLTKTFWSSQLALETCKQNFGGVRTFFIGSGFVVSGIKQCTKLFIINKYCVILLTNLQINTYSDLFLQGL